MNTYWSRGPLSLGVIALVMLSSQAAFAAPGQSSGYRQFDKRYTDGKLNDGEHGFFVTIGSTSTVFHGDAGPTGDQMSLALASQFLKADARLFGRQEILLQGGIEGQASRTGTALAQAYTCAKGRLRVMGTDVLPDAGICTDRPMDSFVQPRDRITQTFFKKRGSASVSFITVSVELEAKGTLGMQLIADTRNSSATQGSTAVELAASGNLEVIGKLSVGVDYVLRVEVRGRITLMSIDFTPQAAAARSYDRARPLDERARYKLRVDAPLTIRGLDGKVSVAAFGNPTAVAPFLFVPVEVKLDETTVWDPPALVNFTGSIHSGSATESYRADFGI
jgi:hypothetical protein